jgi:hypothetical protein
MARIFFEDQGDRRPAPKIDWSVVGPRDERRRAATRERSKPLKTSERPRSSFSADTCRRITSSPHTLAMVAVAKGDPSALWIATATLDRYLWATK